MLAEKRKWDGGMRGLLNFLERDIGMPPDWALIYSILRPVLWSHDSRSCIYIDSLSHWFCI